MNQIRKATIKDAKLLSKLSIDSFLPAHGHSASKEEIDNYLTNNFSKEGIENELADAKNHFFLLEYKNTIVGYSKIVFNSKNENIVAQNCTYMSRLYLLKEYYRLGLGKELLDYSIQTSKEYKQNGIWLAVWIENKRAIQFYTKMGFKIIGKYDFKISERHSNPNHVMYLEF